MLSIKPDERAELNRIMAGGEFNRTFWHSRWNEAREPNPEDLLRAELRTISEETIQGRRQARKIVRKLKKLAGRQRAFSQAGYAQSWSDEQKRLSNLEHAAVYISRANSGFHFYA